MKNYSFKNLILVVSVVTATLAGCAQSDPEHLAVEASEQGTISFAVAEQTSEVTTKAVTAIETILEYERHVNSVQILVFDSDGALNIYKNNGVALSGSISTTTGSKSVWAVVNGPDLSSVSTLSELKGRAIDLSQNKTAQDQGFVMTGFAPCQVNSTATASCNISVSRLVSRVALSSVTNQLPPSYGSLTIGEVYLSNVVGNQNLEGSAPASTWYNQQGRSDESPRVQSHIIDGTTYMASCPDLTFKRVNTTVSQNTSHDFETGALFYTFPNSSTSAPTAFTQTFAAQRTVLTIAATISGHKYYYPVALDKSTLSRNTTYTVGVTITGLGSEDPGEPVSKGSMTVNISVLPWATGATYDETI